MIRVYIIIRRKKSLLFHNVALAAAGFFFSFLFLRGGGSSFHRFQKLELAIADTRVRNANQQNYGTTCQTGPQ